MDLLGEYFTIFSFNLLSDVALKDCAFIVPFTALIAVPELLLVVIVPDAVMFFMLIKLSSVSMSTLSVSLILRANYPLKSKGPPLQYILLPVICPSAVTVLALTESSEDSELTLTVPSNVALPSLPEIVKYGVFPKLLTDVILLACIFIVFI